MSDLISVIVPVYNAQAYLRECLDSLLVQTYKNLEIILIDDGSTDNSLEICKKYAGKDKRIIVINQVNSGPGAARNRGLQIAKGEYIGFVDSDDYIKQDMYEHLYSVIKEHKVQLAVCKVYRDLQGSSNNIQKSIRVLNTQSALVEICSANEFSGYLPNKLFQRALWDNIEISNAEVFEDLAVCIHTVKGLDMVAFSDAEKYYYRYLPQSQSYKRSLRNIIFYFDITNALLVYAKHKGWEKLKNQLYVNQINYVLINMCCAVKYKDTDKQKIEFLMQCLSGVCRAYLSTKTSICKKLLVTFIYINYPFGILLYTTFLKLFAPKKWRRL